MWQEFQTKSFVGVARAHPGFEPGIKDSHAQCRASFASGVVCIHHNSSGAPFLGARRCWFTDCGDELLRSHEGRSFRSWWRLIGMRHAPLGEISGGCLASPAPPTQWTRRLSQPLSGRVASIRQGMLRLMSRVLRRRQVQAKGLFHNLPLLSRIAACCRLLGRHLVRSNSECRLVRHAFICFFFCRIVHGRINDGGNGRLLSKRFVGQP